MDALCLDDDDDTLVEYLAHMDGRMYRSTNKKRTRGAIEEGESHVIDEEDHPFMT